jgi:hypothetical protein
MLAFLHRVDIGNLSLKIEFSMNLGLERGRRWHTKPCHLVADIRQIDILRVEKSECPRVTPVSFVGNARTMLQGIFQANTSIEQPPRSSMVVHSALANLF